MSLKLLLPTLGQQQTLCLQFGGGTTPMEITRTPLTMRHTSTNVWKYLCWKVRDDDSQHALVFTVLDILLYCNTLPHFYVHTLFQHSHETRAGTAGSWSMAADRGPEYPFPTHKNTCLNVCHCVLYVCTFHNYCISGWMFAISARAVHLCPTRERWKKLQVWPLRICVPPSPSLPSSSALVPPPSLLSSPSPALMITSITTGLAWNSWTIGFVRPVACVSANGKWKMSMGKAMRLRVRTLFLPGSIILGVWKPLLWYMLMLNDCFAGVVRPGSEVLDILIHEKQPKRTLNKNTGQIAIQW